MSTNILNGHDYWTELRHITADRVLTVYRRPSATNELRADVADSVPATHQPTSYCAEGVCGLWGLHWGAEGSRHVDEPHV